MRGFLAYDVRMTEPLEYLRTMLRIRAFEERLLALFREGALRGTAHVCLGQEAVAAGACAALGQADLVTSNHRGHGHLIAKGGDPARIMAELFGTATGYSLGRGGSQHMAAPDCGFLGSNGITAGGMPIAAGAALSLQLRNVPAICLCFFGDGATAQGAFHEAVNLAAVWTLPVVFLCENNLYAMGTHVRATCPTATVAERAAGYGLAYETVDGNDPEAVEAAVARARDRALAGEGPGFVEALTWRKAGHSRSDTCTYRAAEDEAHWDTRDPIRVLRAHLIDAGTLTPADADALAQTAADEVEAAVRAAREAAPLPVERAGDLVYPTLRPAALPPPAAGAAQARTCSYADALHRALARALQDESVVLLGEDIADYQGAFRVTRDLYERFGANRVRNTPISENGIVGAGVGAALTGLRPVVEIMFMDFLLLALDQLGNHAAKFSYIFGGQARVPLTLRTPAGGRRGYGATHSQCFESLLLGIPGLKIFNPATVQDAYDLLLAAVFDDAPVAFVEHKLLYGQTGTLDPTAAPLPPGTARVVRPGSHLTIVTFSHMLGLAEQAADFLARDGVEAEVIDLRTLEPLDLATVSASAERTQRVLVAEEGPRRSGVGAELAARLQEACFGYLDAPVLRVAADDVPVPTAEHLERAVLPQADDIVRAARQLLE